MRSMYEPDWVSNTSMSRHIVVAAFLVVLFSCLDGPLCAQCDCEAEPLDVPFETPLDPEADGPRWYSFKTTDKYLLVDQLTDGVARPLESDLTTCCEISENGPSNNTQVNPDPDGRTLYAQVADPRRTMLRVREFDPPSNDRCFGAVDLDVSVPRTVIVSGYTVGAQRPSPDVWYRLVGTDGWTRAWGEETSLPIGIEVFFGSCRNLQRLEELFPRQNIQRERNSPLVWLASRDVNYYLRVSGWARAYRLHVNSILDCNENDVDDALDVERGVETDCDGNGIPDSCDIYPPRLLVETDDTELFRSTTLNEPSLQERSVAPRLVDLDHDGAAELIYGSPEGVCSSVPVWPLEIKKWSG